MEIQRTILFLCFFFFFFFNTPSMAQNTSSPDFLTCFTNHQIPSAAASEILFTPSSPDFTTVLQSQIRNRRFNISSTPKPAVIITPNTEGEVSAAVICAKQLNIQLKIRSGGHDYEGLSYVNAEPFVILDMFNFREIDINIANETAWVGSGAYLGELYYQISQKSRVHGFPAGVCPTVGAGGHISGAGYGNLLRKHGLTVDHMIDAKIVDAQGRVLDRSSMGEDLFWAIRGGGAGSFGVILSYKIRLVPVPETVSVFRVERFFAEDAVQVLHQFQEVTSTLDNDLFIRALIQTNTVNRTRTIRVTFIGLFLGGADRLVAITDSEFPLLRLNRSVVQEMSWIQSVLYWGVNVNETNPSVLATRTPDEIVFLKRKSDYVKNPISEADLVTIFNKMIELGRVGLVFNSYGGRMAEIPETETPFPHRAGNLFKIQYSANWRDEGEAAETDNIGQIRELYEFMAPYVSQNPREAYLNYRDLDIGTTDNGANSYSQGQVYGRKYFKGNFDRLVQIKTKVDPDNFFRNEQSIPVLPSLGRKARR